MPDIDRAIEILWQAASLWEEDPTSDMVHELIVEAIGHLEGIIEEDQDVSIA